MSTVEVVTSKTTDAVAIADEPLARGYLRGAIDVMIAAAGIVARPSRIAVIHDDRTRGYAKAIGELDPTSS